MIASPHLGVRTAKRPTHAGKVLFFYQCTSVAQCLSDSDIRVWNMQVISIIHLLEYCSCCSSIGCVVNMEYFGPSYRILHVLVISNEPYNYPESSYSTVED